MPSRLPAVFNQPNFRKLNFTITKAKIALIPAKFSEYAVKIVANNQLTKLQKQLDDIQNGTTNTKTWTIMSYLPWILLASHFICMLWTKWSKKTNAFDNEYTFLIQWPKLSQATTNLTSSPSWIPYDAACSLLCRRN